MAFATTSTNSFSNVRIGQILAPVSGHFELRSAAAAALERIACASKKGFRFAPDPTKPFAPAKATVKDRRKQYASFRRQARHRRQRDDGCPASEGPGAGEDALRSRPRQWRHLRRRAWPAGQWQFLCWLFPRPGRQQTECLLYDGVISQRVGSSEIKQPEYAPLSSACRAYDLGRTGLISAFAGPYAWVSNGTSCTQALWQTTAPKREHQETFGRSGRFAAHSPRYETDPQSEKMSPSGRAVVVRVRRLWGAVRQSW